MVAMRPHVPRRITSQPSVSTNLLRADTMPLGTKIWAEDEGDGGDEVWMLVEVLRQDNTMLTVRKNNTGEELAIDLGFEETYPPNPKVVADMTSLHHIHEPGILHNLGERSKLEDQRPYTFMGTILIAVNPLRRVPNPEMTAYMDCSVNPETPHPYAIAELAFHQMRLGAGRRVANQSIVVSGESGAGKTETSKIILNFLTHRSVGGVASLDQKVVASSPILESFGNAKTLRNNNSSRFGKFLKLQFTKDKYRLAGAFIENYLLEKSRVLTQGKGERNFHILYQLVAGASGVGIDLKLKGVESYKILSQSDCTTLDDVDDAAEFRTVKGAFDTIGIDGESQLQVWQMLASVLHLSNVEFDKVDHEQGEMAAISDRETLSTLAAFLAVEESALEAMLTQRVVVTRGETFTKQLSTDDANLTRDAIVKSLYEALFLWIVSVINTSLGKGEDSLPFIGVLDIFGFENFDKKNDFEQLLINFTNESLQNTFNKQVFINERKLYEEEGIDVVVSTCPDNAACILMLSTKPKGIIPSLDNVCAEPNPSDSRFLDGLHKTYARHQDFPRTQPRDMRENFWVKHYAGKVKYTVEGWVERNMDRIPESFGGTLAASTHTVVKESTSKYGQAPAGAKPTRSRKSAVKPTVAKAFLASMQDLNTTLLSTTCNFIRCIKPNAAMKCGVYNNRYVVEQLQCLGILQTCEVLKVGMPTRVSYTELKEVLGENAAQAQKLFEGEPETALIAGILWAFEVPSEVFRLGRTRVFFRAGQISTLQKILNETGPEKGPWIFERLQQALANRHKAKEAATAAQAAVESALAAVTEAQEVTSNAIGAEENDEDGAATRPPPKSILSDDDEYKLESAVKKARIAGNSIPQVKQLIQAAKEDEIGTYLVGAFERVMTASDEAINTIEASAAKVDELDVATRTAKGGDAAQEIRKLEDSLKRLRRSFQEAKDLATGAEEAAAKCQVEKTQERVEETKRKASAVTGEAAKVVSGAKGIAQAAERQLQALSKANDLLPSVNAATDEALAAFSSFKSLIAETSKKETAAKEASDAKAEAEAAARMQQATARARMESTMSSMKNLSLGASEGGDGVAALPSAAPGRGKRGRLLKKQASQSVKNLLDTVGTPDTSVSPNRKKKSNEDSLAGPAVVGPGPGGVMFGGGARAYKEMFDEAMKGGCVEGHLMKQSKYFSRWKPRYFRLEDGFLTYYDKKSLVGTHKNKGMELTAHSITSYTNTKNCFCVRTGETVWFLLGKDEAALNKWMTAIDAQIQGLLIKLYNMPEDNYWSQGRIYGFPPSAKDPIPLLFGPGLESQQTVPAPGEDAAVAGGKTAGTVGGVVDRIAGGVAKSWTLKDRWWTGRQGQKQHDAPTMKASEGLKQEAEDGSLAFGLTPADAGDAASLPGGGGGGKTAFVEAAGASGMDERSSKDKAAQAFGGGMETSRRETAVSCGLSEREHVLTTSLGPGPVTYLSEPHAIEFELQAGSLDEELSLGMTITRNLAFVDCRTEGSSRAPFYDDTSTEEFLAMTFVHGPEGVTFPEDKPAKLRFFLGYVDESTPAGEGVDQVAISDEEIERDVLKTYTPLTSPDGVEDWTTLGPYSVMFRRQLGEREVWVETPVNHFSVTANAMKTDKGAKNQSYYYGDLGGLRWWFKGRSRVPKVRFGNTTKEHCATFTCYPIVLHTEVSGERERYAEIGASQISVAGGKRDQHSAAGGPLPAASEKITNIVDVGTYEDCDLLCDLKQHLQMNVRVGILSDLTGEGVKLKGKLQLLDLRKISGNKILVLRQPRLSRPSHFDEIDWPCKPEVICQA